MFIFTEISISVSKVKSYTFCQVKCIDKCHDFTIKVEAYEGDPELYVG
jgi:hypothetical protein